MNDNEVPRLAYLTNLVNSVTNLSMETAEEWQIANYGIGGQYDPHFDFARVNGNYIILMKNYEITKFNF